MKVHQGKVHDYLGMKLDYSEKKKIKIDMKDYVKGMFGSFPIKFKEGETATTPAGEDLFGQKLATKRSTTAVSVGADDVTTMMLWTKLFMEVQGYKIDENIL